MPIAVTRGPNVLCKKTMYFDGLQTLNGLNRKYTVQKGQACTIFELTDSINLKMNYLSSQFIEDRLL